ncbi:MAG: aminotransferase class I/II-fold pyridoxal phosphate-dependent enzyme [Proteobacteria bacterium]|nr:aminotransferase class I/II-fold pyridoxal phosphate-dependent enzyme [Pseudomonadota bacterium]
MFWDLAADTWGPEERAAIDRVVKSGRYTIGPEVAAFEEAFAAYHGKKHAVMVNSGSSANLIAVAALFHKKEKPLERGDEVIVPAVSWSTTYHPLQQYGLKLRFVDVARRWCRDTDSGDQRTGACHDRLSGLGAHALLDPQRGAERSGEG